MALDEPRETDEVFHINGFQFIVDKAFYKKAQPITVDFVGYGFRITSSLPLGQGGGCGGCQGSCSTGD